MSFDEYLAQQRGRIDRVLEALVPDLTGPASLVGQAMRHAVLGRGKRLRPIVLIAAHQACGGRAESVLEPAAALELIHAYSLVHDDLPAMDDDDLRRGRPTVHRVYGEAVAILAGDALLTLAFEVLGGRPPDASAAARSESVVLAARGAGIAGMVGGQVADLEGEHCEVSPAALEWIHVHKTAALFRASAEIGALHAAAGLDARARLAEYGALLGLAFQIADDLLDITADRQTLGKTPGKDARAGKATYPALFGIEASRSKAQALAERAILHLEPFGALGRPLEDLARLAVSRSG